MNTPEKIINEAISDHDPSHIILAVSGGYDSLCMAHYIHKNMKFDRPLLVYAIDTLLCADGWLSWIDSIAHGYGWCFDIYRNRKGWEQYVEFIRHHGHPFSRQGHTYAYWRLKDRAFADMLRDHKREWRGRKKRNDRIMFVTGIRRDESPERKDAAYIQKRKSDVWVNAIADWSADDILAYRIENEIPENPFYETVGGSGDCQCNWGNFITFRKLEKYSPELAAGNVKLIDKIGREFHGYGWDGRLEGQEEMFADFEDVGEMCSPFLCEGCSRSKSPKPGYEKAARDTYEQMVLW